MLSRSHLIGFGIAGVLILIAVYFITTFNRLVREDEGVLLSWSELQNVYKRRADMVPSLVSIVKGAAEYEQTVLDDVTTARTRASAFTTSSLNAGAYQNQEEAQSQLALSMNRAIAVVEAYPDLKASDNFLYLQSQLEGTERRIKFARKDFNESVNKYNNRVRQFPSSLVARLTGFKIKEGFKADAGDQLAPEVKFNSSLK
jgi:LemA protein